MIRALFHLGLSLMIVTSVAEATVLRVANEYPTIQEAIDASVDGDYHLQSQAGRWHADDRTWVQDDATSPCIDAGHRNTALGLEPFPNGGVINIGAYGGTVEASKSYFGTESCSTIMTGDINGDCKVDLQDLELLVSHWLWQGDPYEPEPIPHEVYHSE